MKISILVKDIPTSQSIEMAFLDLTIVIKQKKKFCYVSNGCVCKNEDELKSLSMDSTMGLLCECYFLL